MQYKKILFNVLPILLFVIISIIYFSPALDGKVVNQSDITQYVGSAQEITNHRKAYDEEPLWTNTVFSGMPAYMISVRYPHQYIGKLQKWMTFKLPRPISYLLLSLICFYVLMVAMGCSWWLSLIGALAFSFSSYFFIIINVGHNAKAVAIAYMGMVMAGVILTYKGKYLWGGLLTATALGLELSAKHPQITYYLAFIILFYAIFQFVEDYKSKTLKRFFIASGTLLFAAGIAFTLNLAPYLTKLEYKDYSTRGHSELTSTGQKKTEEASSSSKKNYDLDYITNWSYGIGETLTFLVPDLMGGANQRTPGIDSHVYETAVNNRVPKAQAKSIAESLPMYWGKQPFTAGPLYYGAIVTFLFVLGLFLIKGKYKWWIVSATTLSLMLGWGHHMMWFNKLMIYYLPGFDSFRTPSMAMTIAEFTFPLMAVLALKEVFSGNIDKKVLQQKLLRSFYIVGGICVFLILFSGSLFDFVGQSDARMIQSGYPEWLINALRQDRAAMAKSDSFRSLIFIAIAFTALFSHLKGKLQLKHSVLILTTAILIDMWGIDKRYMNNDDFVPTQEINNPFKKTPADELILRDTDPYYRVFNTTVNSFNDNSTSYFHKSVGGYSAVKLMRYQDLIEHHLSRGNQKVLNMLNTKYYIVKGKEGQPTVRKNGGALGNAWFVQNIQVVADADAEIGALNSFNPANEMIVDRRFEENISNFKAQRDSTASIKLTSYKANELKFNYNSAVEQMTVFSDIYYDAGWKVFVDGKETPYFRANYVLRAMKLPAGQHEIVWKFHPKTFYKGATLTLIAFLILIGVFFIGLFLDRKKILALAKQA